MNLKINLNKMKKLLLIVLVAFSFSITSCSSDDDSANGNNYPQTVNIKFDISTTRNSDAIINRTLNNNTETDEITSLPYSFTYAQQEVNQGTYLKLTFQDNGVYAATNEGSTWTDYDAELKITVGNNVVKTQTFEMTEGTGIVQIDYTFE
jgi:uncharacterized protein YxeA